MKDFFHKQSFRRCHFGSKELKKPKSQQMLSTCLPSPTSKDFRLTIKISIKQYISQYHTEKLEKLQVTSQYYPTEEMFK